MKTKFTLFLVLIINTLQAQTPSDDNPDFFIATNGVTCNCENANFGETGTFTINGQSVTYTKRTRADLDVLISTDEDDPEIALTCTSGITDMSSLFFQSDFNQNISSWDVSNVTTMASMFKFALDFDQPLDVWDVSNVANMSEMFYNIFAFNQPLNEWDVSKVTDMSEMFYFNSSFNQPIDNWDVSSVIDMTGMFEFAFFNQDISNWCVEQIPTEPLNFSNLSNLQNDFNPNWGATCSLSNKDFNVLALRVYPNPITNGVLQISGLNTDDSINMEIVTILGKTVMSKNYQDVTRLLTLNVQDLNAGVYFVKLSLGKATHTSKVIIQ